MRKYFILILSIFLFFSCGIDQEYQVKYDIYKTSCQNKGGELKYFEGTSFFDGNEFTYIKTQIFCYKGNDFLYIQGFDKPNETEIQYYKTILSSKK